MQGADFTEIVVAVVQHNCRNLEPEAQTETGKARRVADLQFAALFGVVAEADQFAVDVPDLPPPRFDREVGADRVFSKPFDREDLIQAVQKLLGKLH